MVKKQARVHRIVIICRNNQSKSYKVEISFAAKIPMQAIAQALRGQDSKNSQEAIRVLNIIVRQHAAKQYVIAPDFFRVCHVIDI